MQTEWKNFVAKICVQTRKFTMVTKLDVLLQISFVGRVLAWDLMADGGDTETSQLGNN